MIETWNTSNACWDWNTLLDEVTYLIQLEITWASAKNELVFALSLCKPRCALQIYHTTEGCSGSSANFESLCDQFGWFQFYKALSWPKKFCLEMIHNGLKFEMLAPW